MASRKIRSRWLMNGNRKPLALVRIAGLNLQGKPQKSSMSIFSFGSRELQTTIFIVQFSIGSYRWTISKSFEEIREFHNVILTDSTLRSGREYFTLPFPSGKDGETDTMILVERREMIESLLKEILNVLDFEIYEPLYTFMDAEPHVLYLSKNVKIITKVLRSQVARKRLTQRLFRFYSQELLNFMYTMEAGIEVYNMDEQGEPDVYMLWLDVCEEPSLSRICLAPKKIFALPKAYEDERLANGIFLSDIAEIRKGASSHTFRSYPFTHLLRPELCVCIVGSERTISVQFIHELLPPTPGNVVVVNSPPSVPVDSRPPSPLPSTSTAIATPSTPPPAKKKMIVDRAYFIDMLNLMAIQSLTPSELKFRQRKFTRASPHSSVKVFPNHILTTKVKENANKLLSLLTKGIEVDEETFSPYLGIRIYQKNLQYDVNSRKLFINSLTSATTTPTADTSSVSNSSFDDERAMSTSPLLPLTVTVTGKELQDIVEAENEDEDEEEEEEEGDEEVHRVGSNTPLLENIEEEGSQNSNEDNNLGDDGERTSSSSQSSLSQRNTMDSLHNPEYYNHPPALTNPGTLLASISGGGSKDHTPEEEQQIPHKNIDLSHLKFDLTTQNRSIDIDDVCEIRPGKVSPLIDGVNIEDNDSLYVSIIASESILVLPVPSLVVRNNLIKRFQAFLLVHRDYAGLDSDTPTVFRKKTSLSSPRLGNAQRVVASSLPPLPPGTLITFNSPAQVTKKTSTKYKKTASSKKSKKTSTRTSASASAPIPINTMNANGIAASTTSPSSSLVNTPSSGGVYVTAGTSPPANPSIPSAAAAKRRRSAPSVTLATQLSQLNNRHIYSHTKQTRSVSIVRRSSNSSRGPSSISESFQTAIGNSRTTSLDF
eukprot:gene5634-6056_t